MKSHRTPWFKQILLQATFSPAGIPKLGWLILVGFLLFSHLFEDGVLFPIPKVMKWVPDFASRSINSEVPSPSKFIISSSVSKGHINASTDTEFSGLSFYLPLDFSPEIEAENRQLFDQRQEN